MAEVVTSVVGGVEGLEGQVVEERAVVPGTVVSGDVGLVEGAVWSVEFRIEVSVVVEVGLVRAVVSEVDGAIGPVVNYSDVASGVADVAIKEGGVALVL